MRLRTIKPSFFRNERLAELSPLHRILFQGLWCAADRDGRLEDRPKRIKADILPYDDVDVERMLADLHANAFIVRYVADGVRCIAVAKFHTHQKPHPRETSYGLPPPHLSTIKPSQSPAEQDLGTAEPGKGDDEPGGLLSFVSLSLGSGDGAVAPTPAPQKPEHQEIIDSLTSEFREIRGSKYGFDKRHDPKAAQALREFGPLEEIRTRWRRALRHEGYPTVSSFADLVRFWNRFATDGPRKNGPLRAEDFKHGKAGEDVTHEL